MLLQIIFWASGFAVLHSYLFYPLLVKLISLGKKNNSTVYLESEEPPEVTILIPAFNEEAVIREKIESVLRSDYPKSKIQIMVGSDGSNDGTNDIVKGFEKENPIQLIEFKGRSGKASIVNQLVVLAKHEIIILTDANIIFDPRTIYELVKHFKNGSISLVDSNMQHSGLKKEGIAFQEKTYIRNEVAVKHAEGLLWGCMMGPSGGCFAFRKKHFVNIPSNFLVDDFYINMKVLEKGGKAINELNALVYEDVPHIISEEFRRKTRIATGNFQNLFAFFHFLLKFNAITFCFFSHKVLRWIGPLFMTMAYFSSMILAFHSGTINSLYSIIFLSLNALILLPLVDWLLKKMNVHLFLLRLITHFFSMNLALLLGLFRFMGGVSSGTWKPTQRNQ